MKAGTIIRGSLRRANIPARDVAVVVKDSRPVRSRVVYQAVDVVVGGKIPRVVKAKIYKNSGGLSAKIDGSMVKVNYDPKTRFAYQA